MPGNIAAPPPEGPNYHSSATCCTVTAPLAEPLYGGSSAPEEHRNIAFLQRRSAERGGSSGKFPGGPAAPRGRPLRSPTEGASSPGLAAFATGTAVVSLGIRRIRYRPQGCAAQTAARLAIRRAACPAARGDPPGGTHASGPGPSWPGFPGRRRLATSRCRFVLRRR
jgi:hypothetical protein